MTMEKFIKQPTPNWPAVTIRRNGSASINHQAVDEFKLRDKRFAILFFDQKEATMAIKPVDDDTDPSAFKIRKEKNRTLVIWCRSFLIHYGIPFKEGSRVMRAGYDEKADMILLKLS